MTDSIAWSIVYWLGLLAAGYTVMAATGAGRSRLDRIGLGACLGPGIFGMCLIALSMLGQRPTRAVVLVLAVGFAISACLLARRVLRTERSAWRASPFQPLPGPWRLLLVAAVGYGLVAVADDALSPNVNDWDAAAIWQLKSKVLLESPLIPRPAYFTDVNLSFSHLRYPILAPMISAGIRALAGAADDGIGKSPFLLMYLGIGTAIFAEIRRRRAALPAAIATMLAMTTPVLMELAGTGNAEMPLVAFSAAALVFLLRWQEEQRWNDLILAAVATALLMWTKNEGMALGVFIGLAVAFLTPRPTAVRSVTGTCLFAVTVLLLYLPWWFYTAGLPRTDEDYAGRLASGQIVHHLPAMAMALAELIWEMCHVADWSLFWFVLAGAMLLRWRQLRSRAVITLICVIGLQLLADSAALAVTDWRLDKLLPLVRHRFLLQLIPAAALVMGAA